MKKNLFLFFLLFTVFPAKKVFAFTPPDEGMWLPMLVQRLNYTDMQKEGLQLTAEEIYSINHASLKDAIVMLGGGFCSSEIVSPEGLLLTNHHCGYDAIQSHSSVEHDYLNDGFWAMKKSDELPNPGLTASILVRMEDVTQRVLKAAEAAGKDGRAAAIAKEEDAIQNEAIEGTDYDAVVKSFFDGNEFYLFVYETFRDVRLVGAPPSSIGKFGGDTDNWMWPRQTGDFSMFRIYAGKDNKPADFSKDNKPYAPKHFLPVSLKGVEEGDFAMIMGFPGSTDRYLTSFGIEEALDITNPTRVAIRDKRLEIMREAMNSSDKTRIQYASKYASVSNYWKYFIGQSEGLKNLNVLAKKQKTENDFSQWIKSSPERSKKYGNALADIKDAYKTLDNTALHNVYLNEAVFGIEAYGQAYGLAAMEQLLGDTEANKEQIAQTVAALKEEATNFFKDYDAAVDQKTLSNMLQMYAANVPADQQADLIAVIKKKYKGNFDAYAAKAFAQSILANEARFNSFLDNPSLKVLQSDMIYTGMMDLLNNYRQKASPTRRDAFGKLEEGNRLFIAGLREMNPDKKYYPNANSTPRITYGKVMSYEPRDGVMYKYYTTTKGILEKEDPNNDEFIVPARLKELIEKKDYGRYGKDGELVVNFISNLDITGGNSGSAVVNGKGELIGIAFDGNWEAMSGDIAFEPELQRCISVDIRYVLFIIDKFAGAKHLVDEMTIVQTQEKPAPKPATQGSK